MSAESTVGVDLGPAAVRRSKRHYWPPILMGLGGVSVAAGGSLHPHETQDTMTDTLLGLLSSPVWLPAHVLILTGIVLVLAGFVGARRSGLFPDRVRGWLMAAIVCWAAGMVETVPHLLASSEHHALETGQPTPLVAAHLTLSVVTSPLVGLSLAALAVVVARAAGTWPSRLLAVAAVLGGVAFAAAAPLMAVTQDARFSALFAGDSLMALWLVGTALRLLLAQREARA